MTNEVEHPGPARTVQEPSAVSQPFWDATRHRELIVQWCGRCEHAIYYPRVLCPGCGSTELGWRTCTGLGTVYANATHGGAGSAGGGGTTASYCVALIDVDEGFRMLSNVVGSDPDDVRVGQRVEVCWEPLPDGRALALFRPLRTC
jgi:uncharacterized OB-fold protein